MKRKRESPHKRWKRSRTRRKPFKPNDTYLREYEEAMILGDMVRVGGDSIGPSDLRRLEPGRYSVKLAQAMKRMAGANGPLEPSGHMNWPFKQKTYQLRNRMKSKEAA